MRPLPVGTLTLLFSDIEGSTSMLQGLGARWGDALSSHRSILRATFAEHGGTEMGTEGDSFFVVFTSAQHALLAAVEAQRRLQEHRWPGDLPLRVRIGLHTGEPERHEDGYIGIDVHRAARIAATASGEQIVVSAATQVLVPNDVEDIEMRDLGWHRLKDLPEPEHLYDVVVSGLSAEHPPLRSLGTLANLPTYATELIGRSRELAELSDAITPGVARLVTLTGTGGTGKTRLAVAVARELQNRFQPDVFFVALHTADRSSIMWSGIAEAIGAPADVDQLPHERALDYLSERKAFLVLDNLEQIPDADAVVSQLLSDAPKVTVLATSRRPLHLVDEYQYPVTALAVPERTSTADIEATQIGAVDLFVRRAKMVQPRFSLTKDNAADVVAVCRRLDGLPLAVELAAARSRLLSPRALLKRIDDRLGESVPEADRTKRQQTLGATISWSYDLLDEENQRVFRRLGVFSNRVNLDAVQDVAGSENQDPLDVVAHLVDVSLVEIVDGPDGEPMIWLLETIRRFARDRLLASEEHDEVRLRHAAWCLRIATEIGGLLNGPTQMSALDRMDAVEEDIRSALDWCLSPAKESAAERHERGFALLEPMDSYWYRFGYIAEGRGWHDRALTVLEGDASADSPRVVDALHGQGILAVQQNDIRTGARALEQAVQMARRLGDRFREARESNSLGIARREAGDVEGARDLIQRSISLAREIGDPHREATALTNVVHIHLDTGNYAAAVDAAREAIAADKALEDPWGVAINQCNLISALLNAEGPRAAYEQLVAVAADAVALGDIELSIDVIDSSAAVWAGLGEAERAATLLGASDNQRAIAGIPRPAPDQEHLDRFIVPAKRSVAPQDWTRAYALGRTLGIEAAVAEGLANKTALHSFAGSQDD